MILKEHISRHLNLAYPVIVGQLGHVMVSVADTAMVGWVGVIPLAGATFAGTIYYIILLFGIGVSMAITPLVAASDPLDKERHHYYLQNGLVLNMLLSIGMFGIAMAFLPFLGYFGQEETVVEAAGPYLAIVGGSLIPLMLFQTFRQYSEGLSNTFHPMLISVIANLINVGLNYVLIFGKLGFPAMGLNGAGYATLIARIIMALMMIAILRKEWIGMKWNIQRTAIRRIMKIGIPSGLQYVFEVGAFAVASIMMGWIGAEALAAHQIALNLSSISYMGATGIATASTIRIGNQLGAKSKPNLITAGYTSYGIVIAFMILTGIIFVFLRYPLTALYIKDADVQSLAASLLIIAAAFQISDGTQTVGLGVLRGLTDVKVPTLVTFLAFWVFSIPLGYVLAFPFGFGPMGIWFGLLGGLSVASILHFIRFRRKVSRLHF